MNDDISGPTFVVLVSGADNYLLIERKSIRVADELDLVELFRWIDVVKTIGQCCSLFVRKHTTRESSDYLEGEGEGEGEGVGEGVRVWGWVSEDYSKLLATIVSNRA